MTFDELKEKALSLPYAPGVYIMRDQTDKVIYVGKAKKLKNRVSQYFQDTASHTPKTRIMVSKIHHFDVIVAASEFEALVLECSLIKRYLPKYNILLKDDKGYPYLRLDMREVYPRITLVSKLSDDGAEYFGPFGGRSVTHDVMEALRLTLKLPGCHLQFPRDIGKNRPCLNYHMNQCAGWCQAEKSCTDYRQTMLQARELLRGNYKSVADQIREQMLAAAENLEFELAASLRDRLQAVENLGQKQLVTAGTLADTDVIGYGQTEAKACFAVLHFSGGNLLDKEYEVFSRPDEKTEAVSSLMKQFYLSRGLAPKRVLLPFPLEDADLFSRLLEQQLGRQPKLLVPQRGDNVRLVELACKNAQEEAERVTGKEERVNATLALLGKMLMLEPPERIESFDISNISGTDIVASMVVFQSGKPHRSSYKRFKLEGLENQDDYASMHQVVKRRFAHYQSGDKGFEAAPDLLLIDGGVNHARVAVSALKELNLDFPVFGMVKDDRHRTKALVTPEGKEIRIDNNQAVFSLIGTIQEETHRFAITYHRQLRSKRLRYSELDSISGIGPKRKQELLRQFKSIQAIRQATLPELERLLPKDAAAAVYSHFQNTESQVDKCESLQEKPEESS
ncbi:MAG: excinuclease ABC subunit UvrC [Clostridiales bacterium]|nr:excinuclease ABC subunit UvrC [Clostridiales bacterium]